MADVNFPSINELGQMEFMSPMAFQQAQKQIGLANLFQQQNLQSGAEDLRTKQLANAYSEQANPLRINQLGLQNAGMESENTIKGVEARTKSALEQDDINSKRQKMLAGLDEDKLKQFQARAEWELMQDDPALQASGMKKIMASKAEFDRRNKQADELQKIAAQGENSKAVANIHAGATLGAARIAADSRQAVAAAKKQGVMDFDQALASGKIGTDKLLAMAVMGATTATDPETQAMWQQRAQLLERMNNNKAGLYGRGGQVDISGMNVPTIQPQSAFGTPPQAPMRPAAPPVPQGQDIPTGKPAGGRVSVVSPDGKVGSIPADQLQQALKAGYKQR